MNERASTTVRRATSTTATPIEVSPVVAGGIVAGIVLVILILAGIHFHQPDQSSIGRMAVPPRLQQQNQQFLATVESLPPASRAGYISHNPVAFQYFIASGTPQEKSDLGKSVGGQ